MFIDRQLFSEDDLEFLKNKANITIDFSRNYSDDEEFNEIADKMIDYIFDHAGYPEEMIMQKIYQHYEGFDNK